MTELSTALQHCEELCRTQKELRANGLIEIAAALDPALFRLGVEIGARLDSRLLRGNRRCNSRI